MADNNIEESDASQVVSLPNSLQSSVEPKLIEGTDEDSDNSLQKTVSTNFVAPIQQEHLMALVLSEIESNLQEISLEQKVPTCDSINLLPEMDSSELASTNEVHDGITSSSCETHHDSNTMKSNTASSMFEAPMQQECPMSPILTDEKGVLQEVSVEQKVPIGDYVAISPKAASCEFPPTNKVPDGFPTSSSDAYESKEVQDDSIKMEASEINVCAASQYLIRLSDGIQDDSSCIDSGKVTCGTPPAILKKAKEDKPQIVNRSHEGQMSLGDTKKKVSAPVSRSSTSKYLRMDKAIVDTTTPIESVKVAASKFGGSINWKTRRPQTAQESDHIILELDKLKNEIAVCKHQAEAAEAAKLSVFNELERTKKIIGEMKCDLERQQAIEVDAKEDLELFQFILQEMEEGVASDDSITVEEKLNNTQERHKSLVAKVILVKDDFRKVQEDYDSLLIESDISIRKAQAAFSASKDDEKQVEELTVENQRLKEVFDLAEATYHDAEEHKKYTQIARDEDSLAWEKDLRQADKELNQISMYLSSVQVLQSKFDTSSSLLLDLKNELATCLEAKLIEEAREKESGTHKSKQEEAIILLRNELEEHRKSISKVTDELCSLKATAASLKSELNKEKAALATIQQREAMASITIQSIKVEIKLCQQELEAVHAKEKERPDKTVELPKVLQDAAKETDEAKSVNAKAQEELGKAKEEVEQAKAYLSTMEFKLEAVMREIEAAKEAQCLALNAIEGTKVASNIKQQGSSQMITLGLNEYTSLIERSHRAEELAHEKTAAAIAQLEAAKESEARTLSTMNETYKALEERKQALLAATEQADRATEGKLAMEQELRKWREENGRRRKAAGDQASKPEAKSSRTTGIISGDTKFTSKEDICAAPSSVHPLSDASGRSSPNDLHLALQAKTKKAKKVSFFPRVIMFLGRRRLKAAAK